MPATRTEPRQGSSRPALQFRQSSLDKAALERQSARQRSKQKARAPLPPPSEIIEISSDDEAPPPAKRPSSSTTALERRIKELEEENKKWKEAALAAQAAQVHPDSLAKQVTPAPDTRFDKFLSTVEDHVSCEICTMKMWHPYTLPCGHTFCRDCLQDWFSTALAQHMAANPQFNPQGIVPHHWRAALARQDLSIIARRQIEREIAMLMDATPQPSYTCPTCRLEVRNRPAENFVVKHLVRTVAGVQGESCPQEDPHPRPGQRVEGPWDGFFPVFRKD